MDIRELNVCDELEIDLEQLLKALWKQAWAILLAALLFGGIVGGICVLKKACFPKFAAQATIYTTYISSQSFNYGGKAGTLTSVNNDEAVNTVSTCVAILDTNEAIQEVINSAGLDLKHSELREIISAEAFNGTNLFTITVTDKEPERAALIANTIVDNLIDKMGVVDSSCSLGVLYRASVPTEPLPGGNYKCVAVAAALGAMLVYAIIVVKELLLQCKAQVREKGSA